LISELASVQEIAIKFGPMYRFAPWCYSPFKMLLYFFPHDAKVLDVVI